MITPLKTRLLLIGVWLSAIIVSIILWGCIIAVAIYIIHKFW